MLRDLCCIFQSREFSGFPIESCTFDTGCHICTWIRVFSQKSLQQKRENFTITGEFIAYECDTQTLRHISADQSYLPKYNVILSAHFDSTFLAMNIMKFLAFVLKNGSFTDQQDH